MQKKGQMEFLKIAAVSFIVIAITLSIGQQILGNMGTDLTANSYEKNATTEGQKGLDEIAGWLDTIGLVVAAGVILGVVAVFIARR